MPSRWTVRDLSEAELAPWTSDDVRRAAPEVLKSSFELARCQIALYSTRIRCFTTGEVFPGIQPVPLPDHTPGHTGYLIESKGDERAGGASPQAGRVP